MSRQGDNAVIPVFIRGVAVWGPGLEGWEVARPVLAGDCDHAPRETPLPAPAMLSSTERRRASQSVRLALTTAQAATAMAGVAPNALRSVFATSNGDGAVVHAILAALTTGDGQVSPTQFHNSVHNAAAGYWSIGTASRQPMTCLGCHDATVAAALLKAAAEVAVERVPTLLCAYDAPLPAPLASARLTEQAFGVALVLAPGDEDEDEEALARLDLRYVAEPAPPPRETLPPSLEQLRATHPVGRVLPLLRALARGTADRVALPMLDGHVEIEIGPCSAYARSPS